MSMNVSQMERELADRPMSENDKIDVLDAYKVYFDAYNTWIACCRAVLACGLPEEDPEYKKLRDAWDEAMSVYIIESDNYEAIYDRLFR